METDTYYNLIFTKIKRKKSKTNVFDFLSITSLTLPFHPKVYQTVLMPV
jgi:hypothetical protein